MCRATATTMSRFPNDVWGSRNVVGGSLVSRHVAAIDLQRVLRHDRTVRRLAERSGSAELVTTNRDLFSGGTTHRVMASRTVALRFPLPEC